MNAFSMRALAFASLVLCATVALGETFTTTPSPVVPDRVFRVTIASSSPFCAVPDKIDVSVVAFHINVIAYFTCMPGDTGSASAITVDVPALPVDEYELDYFVRMRTTSADFYYLPQLAAGTFVEVGDVPQVARIERVSGDRQIIVGTTVPSQAFVVRVVDSAGRPVPRAPLYIGPTGNSEGPTLYDAFGFRGFNAPTMLSSFGFGLPGYGSFSDASGIASTRAPFIDPAPSSQPAGAVLRRKGSAAPVYFSEVLVTHTPAGTPKVVVEYYHAALDHYFDSLDDAEIALLDAGRFTGWQRSIGAFVAYATRADAPADAVPVCRFFSSRFTSHFYTANAEECDEVVARYDDDTWLLETREAFFIQMPDRVTGSCKDGLQPVYRMYSNRPIPNHRYVTDRSLRDRMTGAGWRAEGYGPEAVAMCTAA
jgi:hypothetical protein